MFQQEVKTLKILNADEEEEILFQSYKTTKETGNKELYKIDNYKMAEDIKIPDSATVISSQENLKKYTFNSDKEMNGCIQRTKEYRDNKKKEQG